MDKLLYTIKKYIPIRVFKIFQPIYHFFINCLAAFIYKNPSEKLIVIGVTGTTGKTTSVYLIAKMLENAGYKVGYTSTAMFNDGEKEWLNDKKMTMMGRFFTQRILRNMLRNKCQYAIVETTSEGIRQYRHKFINFDILVFTGLYPEHIESHGSFENYKKAKGELFRHLRKCKTKYACSERNVNCTEKGIKKIELDRIKKTIIVNSDDEHKDYFLSFWSEEKYEYSAESRKKKIENSNLINYSDIKTTSKGTSFMFNKTKVALKLLGDFNAGNAMNAVCLGLSQGLDNKLIKKGLESIKGVPGRMEMIDEGQDFTVIVDYAFEPKALTKLYESISLIEHSKVIHVLGSCGGGRDASRRPVLGKLAGARADYIIVTNEDPYDEDPELIMDAVARGAIKAGAKEYKNKKGNLYKIVDRQEAIKRALLLASKDDIVLITGKGSEQAICIAEGKKIKWDDRAVARELLRT